MTGFRESRWSTVRQIEPGDYFLCYVTGISRFIAVLRATSGGYREDSAIWSREIFPCRVDVEVDAQLTFDTAVPIHSLRDDLSIFEDLTSPHAWTGHVRGSPTRWTSSDGEIVVEAVKQAQRSPVERPFDLRKLERRPRATPSQIGPVTIPGDRESEPEEVQPASAVSDHTEIQWLLLKLGNDMKLDVWVARNDRSRGVNGQQFADLPRIRSSLPAQFDEVTNSIIEHIDVLWLRENAIVAAFEIESTTSIYSGLLRMSDLIAMQPNLNIDLFIVAPDERRSKVITEVNRPTFARLSQPLSSVCRFIPFSELRRKVAEIAPFMSHLNPSFIHELAEDCVPELD
ncbi:hypothetical protein BH23CHL2_BH23CHL2_25850 [soil metagenome]